MKPATDDCYSHLHRVWPSVLEDDNDTLGIDVTPEVLKGGTVNKDE